MIFSELLRFPEPPADDVAIARLMAAVGPLPEAYVSFLREANGGQVGVTDRDGDNLILWKAEKVAEMNQAYEIQRWCPPLLAIGSDGGDDAVAFDRSAGPTPSAWPLVRVGFGNLDPEGFKRLAESFAVWVARQLRLSSGEP